MSGELVPHELVKRQYLEILKEIVTIIQGSTFQKPQRKKPRSENYSQEPCSMQEKDEETHSNRVC